MQLFNAVRKHQKTIDKKVKEAGGSERKKAKLLSSVSKRDFIHVLRRTEGDAGAPTKPEKDTVSSPSAVLIIPSHTLLKSLFGFTPMTLLHLSQRWAN